MNAATAQHRLRAYAHHTRRPMRAVATEVRADHLPFKPRHSDLAQLVNPVGLRRPRYGGRARR